MDTERNKELIDSVVAMQNGDAEAFNTFYKYTSAYVYKRAKFIMQDEDDALDLTQETFVQAYKNINSLAEPENTYAWLGAICYRQGMRIFRSRKEILVDEEVEGIFDDIVSEDIDINPEEANESKETADIVMGLIEELPPLQKAAIISFYYDNKKIDDIAAEFECSANTIKSRLNYAKKYLKEKVEAHEKSHGYRLHSVTPIIITLSIKELFAQSNYALAAETSAKICGALASTTNIAVSATTATSTVATTTGTAATATGTVATTTGAAAATTGTAAATAAASVSVGAKIAIGVATVIIGAGATLGIINGNDNAQETTVQETTRERPTPEPSIPSICNWGYDWNYAEGVYKPYGKPDEPHVLTLSNVHMVNDSTISIDIDYNGLGIQTVESSASSIYDIEVTYVDEQGSIYDLVIYFTCAKNDGSFFVLDLSGTITDTNGNVRNLIESERDYYYLSKNGEIFGDL